MNKPTETIRIAVPVTGGRLSSHFGHCEQFVLFDAIRESKTIAGRTTVPSPPHQPGLLPGWLFEQDVNVIIAGGIGMRAQNFFSQYGIEVMLGASGNDPSALVQAYLDGSLKTGKNICDH